MTTHATRRARVKMSEALYDDCAQLATRLGVSIERVSDLHYIVFVGSGLAENDWGVSAFPGSQRIITAFGTPPKLDLPAEWSILSVVLRVIETLERKDG